MLLIWIKTWFLDPATNGKSKHSSTLIASNRQCIILLTYNNKDFVIRVRAVTKHGLLILQK